MKRLFNLKGDTIMPVTNIRVYGLEGSILASGYPMLSNDSGIEIAEISVIRWCYINLN